MSKKLYTQEQLDHAIDYALKIGDHALDELYGRKNEIERVLKTARKEYRDICSKIEALENERYRCKYLASEGDDNAEPTEESGD